MVTTTSIIENKTMGVLAALAKARLTFGSVKKEAQAYNYKYADLPSILKTVEPALHEAGLLLHHETHQGYLITYLTHLKTGQHISSEMKIGDELDCQQVGSEETYFRRYNILKLLNLSVEDDDGANSPNIKDASPEEAAEYRPSFGKYNGQQLMDIDPDELQNYVDYLLDRGNGSPRVLELCGMVAKFMEGLHDTGAVVAEEASENYSDREVVEIPFPTDRESPRSGSGAPGNG